MKIFSIVVLSFLIFLLVLMAAYLLVMRVFFHKIFGRKKVQKRIEEKSKLIDLYKIDLCFFEKNKFETMNIVSEDGLKLKGYFLSNNSDKVAIVVHGYGCDFREMSSYAKMFFQMGYSVLITQNRGHGESEGFVGMGWLDRKDVAMWTNVLANKNPKCKIVLFGLSMGGAAVCMAAGEQDLKNVVCVVSDCAFKNVFDQIEYVFNKKHKKFKKFLLNQFQNYMKRAYDFDLKLADAKTSLKKSNLPVLIVHGKTDSYVSVKNAYDILENLSPFKHDLFLVEGAEHAMCFSANPRKYENTLREFLKKWNM